MFTDATFWVAEPRDVLMVEGADALTYLNSQVSQDLRPLAVGACAYTLVLQPTGKVEALARVLRSGDHAYMVDVEAGVGEALTARLMRFKIRVAVEITTVAWRCIAVRGPEASQVTSVPGAVAVAAWWGDATATDLLGPAPQPPPGVRAGTLEELELARVTVGWPRHGAEIVESTLPAELGVVSVAVSFTKGCYPGQELVERMDSRGARAPRSVRRVEFDAGVPVAVAPGDAVVVDGVEVGRFTSVVGNRALALVKRDIEFGQEVTPPA
jgi:folate-binding protein YgfZ